jgi:hypothetical protein
MYVRGLKTCLLGSGNSMLVDMANLNITFDKIGELKLLIINFLNVTLEQGVISIRPPHIHTLKKETWLLAFSTE